MDKALFDFFISLNLDEEDIENLMELCPGLEIVDADKAFACVEILVKNGYPIIDMDMLLSMNPGILLYETKDLEKKLKTLNGDIEELLKEDPFLI